MRQRNILFLLLSACLISYFIFLGTGLFSGSDSYRLYSSCDLPTQYGTIKFCVFKQASSGKEAIACVSPLTLVDRVHKNIPVRVHDACITSETFHSVKCDCKLQLDQALKQISTSGGIVIYLYQEGRGIGLANKIAAYHLQETKQLDTVQANRALGLPDDAREYLAIRDILTHFGIESIALMTNNPRKVECLQKLGIRVESTIACLVNPESPQMQKYMNDKAQQMGHLIPIS
jgi:GTP cyclohydrolase II